MVTDPVVRLFVAVELDEAERRAMRRIDWWVDHLDYFRKVPPRNRHVTIAFLGDVADSAIGEIIGALDGCLAGRAAFVMPALGVVSMPSERRQRALALELDAATGFAELAGSVRAALLPTPAGARLLDEPRREVGPHVTVARKKRTGGGSRLDPSSAPPFEGVIGCDRVALMRSELTPQGPIYTPLAGWSLGECGGC